MTDEPLCEYEWRSHRPCGTGYVVHECRAERDRCRLHECWCGATIVKETADD